ncbi:hypothetical protein L6R53_32110 [Myxococcota bacterium]|nr:hypothetical protein [Myxococcota bacterium]
MRSPTLSILLSAFLLSLTGTLACGDKDPGEDSGVCTGDECPEGDLDPLQDFTLNDDDNCEAHSGGHVALGVNILDFEVDGLDEGDVSGSPPSGYNVRARRESGPCSPAASSWCEADGTPEADETWTTDPACTSETSAEGFMSLTNCWGTGYASGEDPCGAGDEESCDGLYLAEIQPDTHSCSDFNPARIEFEYAATYDGATAPAAGCTAGSGRFTLLPRYLADVDNDGDYQAVFDVVQSSGSGTMRRADWVTDIVLVEGQGRSLRVLRDGKTAAFNGSDQLINASTESTAITGTHTFSTGVIPGYPLFVTSETDLDDLYEMEVDLEWSCEASPGTVSGLSTGYIIPTETIGCGTVQDLVLRVYNSPNRVHIEQYGYPQHKVVIPTSNTPSGRRFVYDWNYFHLDATLEDWDSSSADIRIDQMKWDGTNVCDADSYTFQAE